MFNRYLLCLLSIFAATSSPFAIREPIPTAVDSRIRILVYSPDDVFKIIGYYGYQQSIELDQGEEIVSISMGDTTSWQVVPSGSRLFIKPMESDATTNMTMITNKRTYFFELYGQEADGIRDPDMVFSVRFVYPDQMDADALKSYTTAGVVPDLSHPEKYNFNYSISGSEEIAPIKIYDDGDFTYLHFRDKNAQMPAVFAVDEELRESMVNYRIIDGTNIMVIEQVFPKLSARAGKSIVCIFNEAYKK